MSGALSAGGRDLQDDAVQSIVATRGSSTTTNPASPGASGMSWRSPKTSLEVLERADNAGRDTAQPATLDQQPRLFPQHGTHGSPTSSLDSPSRFPLPSSNASSAYPYIPPVLSSNAQPHQQSAARSNLEYANHVHQLSPHFPHLDSVLSRSRYDCASLTIFDYSGDILRGTNQRWTDFNVRNSLSDTRRFISGKSSWSDVDTRLIVSEDIGPSLIKLLGSTFNISPEFFAEHLHRSGYHGGKENDVAPSAWRTSSMHKNYVSVRWYRPGTRWIQEPNTLLQRKEILDPRAGGLRGIEQAPNSVSGTMTEIEYTLQSTTNIFRPEFALSTDPDGIIPEQSPCAWEERATACAVEFDGIRYGLS